MRSVLISIQPKWCELIASGKKTVEVRKTRPKIDTPFKCYIYCTLNHKRDWGDLISIDSPNQEFESYIGNGKVIGEFVCDRIDRFSLAWRVREYIEEAIDGSCLSNNELYDYCKGKREFYTWHISDLVIYDKPKELFEFLNYHKHIACNRKGCFGSDCFICPYNAILKRPPQSWCYVEGLYE